MFFNKISSNKGLDDQTSFLVIPWVVVMPVAFLASSKTGFGLSFTPEPISKSNPHIYS